MNPPDESTTDIDRLIRINELREAAREAAGGEMTSWESPDAPPELAEGFWRHVLDYESADLTTHIVQLERAGVELPRPEQLGDAALAKKLWEVIHALADLRVYLDSTDHLSDRELYTMLWEELLREETPDLPPESGWNCHLDILGGCSDEDLQTHLKYNADDEERQRWRTDYPHDVIPDHVDPPFDRDRRLPRSTD